MSERNAPVSVLDEPCPGTEEHDAAAAELGVSWLGCRECGREYPVSPRHVCDFCFGPVEVVYDYGAIRTRVSRAEIEAGPLSIWRYAALLPAPPVRVDLGAGFTPLRPAPRLAAELGLDRLWIKNDSLNPTNSFKDRVVSVAASAARYFGYDTLACASTGNLANSVAAHAAAAGLRSVVFIPKDLERGKVVATAAFGGEVVALDGSYDDVNRLCSELAAERSWAFVNVNFRAFYAEGSKTLAFEIAEQLGWRAPDAVVAPVASGSLLTKVAKGLKELHLTGLLDEPAGTAVHGGQAEGCSPVATAFAAGTDDVRPVKPDTGARSLAIGNPADGHYALETARSSGGRIVAVPETSVRDGIELLARTEGIFTETAGGVTVATLERLVRSGAIARDEETVVLITGHGLKTLEVLGDRGSYARRPPVGRSRDRSVRRGEVHMSVQVKIPTQLRTATGGEGVVEAGGDTVRGVIGELGERYPGVLPRLLDDAGDLRRFVNLYVDDEDVRFLQGLDTPVEPGSRVTIVPAIAGG